MVSRVHHCHLSSTRVRPLKSLSSSDIIFEGQSINQVMTVARQSMQPQTNIKGRPLKGFSSFLLNRSIMGLCWSYTKASKVVQSWRLTYRPAISLSTCSLTPSSHSYHVTEEYQSLRTIHSACLTSGRPSNQSLSATAGNLDQEKKSLSDVPLIPSFPGGKTFIQRSTPSKVNPILLDAAWLAEFRVVVSH